MTTGRSCFSIFDHVLQRNQDGNDDVGVLFFVDVYAPFVVDGEDFLAYYGNYFTVGVVKFKV